MKWLKRLFGKAGFDPSLQVLSDEVLANTWGAGGGGSGNSQTVLGTWSPFMENMWAGDGRGNPGLLNRAVDTVNTPYQSYGGQRVAGINPDQLNAMGGIRYLAQNGSDIGNLGSQATQSTLRGQYLGANQWTDPATVGYNTEQAKPVFNAQAIQEGKNEFAGDNPYFRSVLEKGIGDITKGYERGTSADLRRAANLSGAFGGSAHQAAIKNNEEALAGNIGNFVNQMANQQYDRSANLREADIGRNLGAQQFNVGTADRNVDRYNQADQYNVGLADRNVDRYNQNRQIGAGQWDSERNRMSQAGNQAINYENQGFNRFGQLMGVGDFGRSYDQSLLDNQYNDWQQSRNWERNNLNWMANLLGQAQGSTGMTISSGGYQGISPAAGLLGAAAIGRGMQWI